MENKVQSIDYGMDTDRAVHLNKYNDKIKRLKAIAAGEIEMPKKKEPESEQYGLPIDESESEPVTQNAGGVFIPIADKKLKFEISYPAEYPNDETKLMYPPITVELEAFNVDASEDAISIIMDPSTTIKFPKLKPMIFKFDGIKYKVAWAGAMTTFGTLRYISFIKVG